MTERPIEVFPPAPASAPRALTPERVRSRLADPALWDRLGFYPEDRAELDRLLEAIGPADLDRVAAATGPVLGLIGDRLGPQAKDFFDVLPDEPGQPRGLLPLLALAVTSPEVRAYGRRLGLSAEVAASGLRDLGQQVHVHRLVTGSFGLHTQWWLTVAWSGTLWWLGRLQFNVVRYDGRLHLSAHIPQTGPLTGVQESFDQARELAAGPLAGLDLAGFHCDSWLLDPNLSEALEGRGNIAAFQRLWQLREESRPADGDAIFFTFRTREQVGPEQLARLPQRTSLERAVVGRLRAGRHWSSRVGVIRPLRRETPPVT
ncbi:hypothetical protein GCG21_06915 [Pseudactinotalea sp. HY160]|uniref:acyltransferase domain-containing protein n=1 Tax=Pseudactinotalea sp. HY160 TaxID=2654490 RepID=UPI00128B887F|nr:acyltransferase domain-containing protein [Pseudactinotalea sp. HY160]MPV49740.1 hypothetical protein [Pseudactinotalea sp. HY160]